MTPREDAVVVEGGTPPRDIGLEPVFDPRDECVHGWSLWGIPRCERCYADHESRERFSLAMRRGAPERLYVITFTTDADNRLAALRDALSEPVA